MIQNYKVIWELNIELHRDLDVELTEHFKNAILCFPSIEKDILTIKGILYESNSTDGCFFKINCLNKRRIRLTHTTHVAITVFDISDFNLHPLGTFWNKIFSSRIKYA